MDKDTRNRIDRATGAARRLLEQEFAQQLEGVYDILPDGTILPQPGAHLDERGRTVRAKLVAAVEFRRQGGATPKEAVAGVLREAAFTTLNRFVALKMLEARGLVQECLSKGDQSSGFKEYGGLAGGLVALPDHGYRLYLESLFDEIGCEVRVLFDRRDVAGLLWPRRQALQDLLATLNDPALAGVWGADETIGWVYQYFNGEDERKKMREESAAPRNSRELAVRNQFFTPRYVVEFLTDNTLGRTWYEMRGGVTALKDRCRYLVRRPDEVFLDSAIPEQVQPAVDWLLGRSETVPDYTALGHTVNGYARLGPPGGDDFWGWAKLPAFRTEGPGALTTQALLDLLFAKCRAERFTWRDESKEDPEITVLVAAIAERRAAARRERATQEEALRAPVFVPPRPRKDPRDLKILDPACGSGHFLLYAFDLLLTIYEEAWADEYGPAWAETGHALRADYPTLDALRRALPGLILAHNLHGIDIDPRAAQIAELALWMRAQRAYRDFGVPAAERPAIRKTNIVVAEPMPGDRAMLEEFLRGVDARLRPLVRAIWDQMRLAGEAGSLLRIEEAIATVVEEARQENLIPPPGVQVALFAANQRPVQTVLVASAEERAWWDRAEAHLLAALRAYAQAAAGAPGMRRRLFAENAAQGFAFVDVCRQHYDVVLMNPPFGAASKDAKAYIEGSYPRSKNDLYAAFVERGLGRLGRGGLLGAITSRTGFFLTTFTRWREEIVLGAARPTVFADLGAGVLDTAMVETAAYCLEATI